MDDDWDTGAAGETGQQDAFNTFDTKISIGGPPANIDALKPKSMEAPKEAAPDLPARAKAFKQDEDVSEPRTFSMKMKNPKKAAGTAFTEKLAPEALAYFNAIAAKPFQEQAVAFLNSYWAEVGSQAEFIFTVAWEVIKAADMHSKGVNYIHLYEEGVDLEFNIGLYFYEKLCQKVLESPEGKKWRNDAKYAMSMPTMQTAIVRKQEIREKVDVNFDGKISFLEYLLYQYREFANPGGLHRAGDAN